MSLRRCQRNVTTAGDDNFKQWLYTFYIDNLHSSFAIPLQQRNHYCSISKEDSCSDKISHVKISVLASYSGGHSWIESWPIVIFPCCSPREWYVWMVRQHRQKALKSHSIEVWCVRCVSHVWSQIVLFYFLNNDSWRHFTIRGAQGTDFEGGIYHGRILVSWLPRASVEHSWVLVSFFWSPVVSSTNELPFNLTVATWVSIQTTTHHLFDTVR